MEVLLTGGNGFVGHHVIEALLERGDRVRVLALPGEDVSWLDDRGVAVYRGDILDPETLLQPVDGAEAVVHLAAMMHVWRPLDDYLAVNVTGTENVCNAALTAGVCRLVHMSSSSVYGMPRVPVDEDFPLSPFPDPYPISKAAADRLVQRMIADAGLPAVILRPDQIFGPGDSLHFGQSADRLRVGRSIIVGRGDNRLPLVYVSDLVQGMLLAVDHEGAVGQAFNISADSTLTQRGMLEVTAREIGAEPPRVHVPYRPLYAAAFAAERLAASTRSARRPPITRLGVAFAARDVRYSIGKAQARLGYSPQVKLDDGVRLTADWYLTTGGERPGAPVSTPRAHSPRRPDTVTDLGNEVAIVTGASSGIGAATACELARNGARVVLAARREAELLELEHAIMAAGGKALAIPTDVTDPAQLSRLVDETEAAFGRVDILVNNAGAFWRRELAGSDPEAIAAVVAVNLLGAMLLTRAVLPGMLERNHGAIVCIGSLSGRVAMEPVYSATKYGLRGFSLALRRQLAGTGVSVSLVSPGNIRTEMTSHVPGLLPEPRIVADEVCKLVRRPRREVVIPRQHGVIAWLEQLLPSVADRAHQARHWSPVE